MALQIRGKVCTRQNMSGFRGLNVWWYNREEGREEIKENKARRTPKEGNKSTSAVKAITERPIPYPNGNVPISISHSISSKKQANAQMGLDACPLISPKLHRDGNRLELQMAA